MQAIDNHNASSRLGEQLRPRQYSPFSNTSEQTLVAGRFSPYLVVPLVFGRNSRATSCVTSAPRDPPCVLPISRSSCPVLSRPAPFVGGVYSIHTIEFNYPPFPTLNYSAILRTSKGYHQTPPTPATHAIHTSKMVGCPNHNVTLSVDAPHVTSQVWAVRRRHTELT